MATPENASIPPAEMSEKMRARMQKGAAPLMEPDETVIYGVFNLTMPAALYMAFAGIALLPYVIQKNSMAVVTQKNVYVFKIRVGTKAHRILLKQPLGSVEAHFGGSGFPGRYVLIGDQKLWQPINRKAHNRARAMAAMASGTAAVLEQPADEATAGSETTP